MPHRGDAASSQVLDKDPLGSAACRGHWVTVFVNVGGGDWDMISAPAGPRRPHDTESPTHGRPGGEAERLSVLLSIIYLITMDLLSCSSTPA